MEEIQKFLDDAVAALHRSSGLSISFSKTAENVQTVARETKMLERVKEARPLSLQEGTALITAGIRLYNVAKKGSVSDKNILMLQLLACYCMCPNGGEAAIDNKTLARFLDASRCLSRVGALLLQVGEKVIGREALCKVLELCGENPIERITEAFGQSQDAHDTGASLFKALSLICATDIEAAVQQDPDGKERMVETVRILSKFAPFISIAKVTAQKDLRNILENGVLTLGLEESVAIQEHLYQDWWLFESSSSDIKRVVACRLCCTLAKRGDTGKAMEALERAESIPSSASTMVYYYAAHCAVAAAKFAEERKIYSLISGASDCLPDTRASANERLQIALSEYTAAFERITQYICEKSPPDVTAFTILLNCAKEVYARLQCVKGSYERIISAVKKDPALTARIVIHVARWVTPREAIEWTLQPSISSLLDGSLPARLRQDLAMSLWNLLCDAKKQCLWKAIFDLANLIISLLDNSAAAPLLGKVQLASLVAKMNDELPNKDGDVICELGILSKLRQDAHVLRQKHKLDKMIVEGAVLLELKCLVRCSIIPSEESASLLILRQLCQDLVQSELIDANVIINAVNDAILLQAIDAARAMVLATMAVLMKETRTPASTVSLKDLVLLLVRIRLLCEIDVQLIDDITTLLQNDASADPQLRLLDTKTRSQITALITETISAATKTNKKLNDVLKQGKMIAVCATLASNDGRRVRLLRAAIGCITLAATESVLHCKSKAQVIGEDDKAVLALCGETSMAAIDTLPEKDRARDPKVGFAFILATIFMAAVTADTDEILASRLSAIYHEGEVVIPKKDGLEIAAEVSMGLGFRRSAMLLLTLLVQYELSDIEPDYEHVVERCLTLLLKDAETYNSAKEWAMQIDNVAKMSVLGPRVLEKAAITLWNKHHALFSPHGIDLATLASNWLGDACSQDAKIMQRRSVDLRLMKASLVAFPQKAHDLMDHHNINHPSDISHAGAAPTFSTHDANGDAKVDTDVALAS